ncbi:MAG TPA: diacylglycerol kinase [Pirellulales bacterium]|nr:diacylglycerol kinase [Pirellulales bacterium]
MSALHDASQSASDGARRFGYNRNHAWGHKFACAARGIVRAVRSQSSFVIHLATAAGVVVAAKVLGADWVEWCILVICIAMVLAAELFNTAIEHLARAITFDDNPELRDALDTSSSAVLVMALGAAVVGVIVLGCRFGITMGWRS